MNRSSLFAAMCAFFWMAGVGVSLSAPPGWTDGTPAEQMSTALATVDPVTVQLPLAIADKVTGPVALLYFSPTCPHCQEIVPEVNALIDKEASNGIAWLGVSVGNASDAQLETFRTEFGPLFSWEVDTDRAFAKAVGARSTPAVYLARPVDPEVAAQNPGSVEVIEAYVPFGRGMSAVFEMRRHPEDPFLGMEGYQGPVLCATCHGSEHLSWAITHHSIAYRTLYQRNRESDTECVGCHVTGLGLEGGFALGDHSSKLADVTCEACHGPSGPHDGDVTPATSTCATCHDAEHSIAFSVEKGLPLIDHYVAKTMSDTELRDRLMEVASGEASRPLLAFPDGPTVGSKECLSCHKSTHRSWSKSPHGKAMDVLGEDADKVECVSCHATQRSYGLGVDNSGVEAFRLDDSVGCESCHGPGMNHVQTPTKDNIVGLGESCPECVIEAICTTCHTTKWDPRWELQKRLDASRHAGIKEKQ